MAQTVFRGIEQAPNAFLGLLKGDNIGENAGRAELIRPVGWYQISLISKCVIPADPVERPTRLKLAINLNTATHGLTIRPTPACPRR